MAKNFEVRLLGTNHNSSHMHYEILKNGKRFIDGWVKTDKFRWHWVIGYVEGNISYETKIVNYLTNQYRFIENLKQKHLKDTLGVVKKVPVRTWLGIIYVWLRWFNGRIS